MKSFQSLIMLIIITTAVLSGCKSTTGNSGSVQSYRVLEGEAEWIRNGEAIEYEGDWWYPQDGVESLLDSEVYLLGEYRGVQFFSDKVDVKPYERIYTKFNKNMFRYYKKKTIKQ